MITAPVPSRSFASDNAAGAHPAVLDSILRANHGHALAYGDDEWTRRCELSFRELFGRPVETLLAFNGTGANVLALAAMLRPAEAVVCSDRAHIAVDETGAPERILGAKLIDLPTPDGKLRPEQVRELAHLRGVQHHVQPGVLSLTQSTELGGVYAPDELGALCDAARSMGMRVHLDGARLANATVALGDSSETLRALTVGAGVDVVTFGGTKNGLLGGEAVVFVDDELARRAPYIRKQVTQLPSKMRFVAAQFEALLHDELWLDLARHANRAALELYRATHELHGLHYDGAPVVNSVFPCLPAGAIGPLQDWCAFWDWEPSRHQVRWMTAWDTADDDIAAFVAGVRQALTMCN